MGETKTGYSYAHENLDDLQVELHEWWGEEGRPFIKQYRNMVWNASIGEAE